VAIDFYMSLYHIQYKGEEVSEEVKEEKKGDPKSFDRIVREVFAPIYPVIAEQILAKCSTTKGRCLDAGCGTGALGRAMAQICDMEMIFFDKSSEMLDLAKGYAKSEGIAHKSSFMEGDIHDTKLKDDSIDLVISRGSSPFWEDWHKAYGEILRVLKRGGSAYIGGGFGTKELKESITAQMSQNNPQWRDSFKDRIVSERQELPQILQSLNPSSYTIIDDDSGWWVYMQK